jgi:hypothetical protein
MEDDEDDDDMDDGGDDSFDENDDMIGVNDVTSQLAAAGWQHGVKFCFVNSPARPARPWSGPAWQGSSNATRHIETTTKTKEETALITSF